MTNRMPKKNPSWSWCFFWWNTHRWPRPRSPSARESGDFIPYRRLDDKLPWNMDLTCDFSMNYFDKNYSHIWLWTGDFHQQLWGFRLHRYYLILYDIMTRWIRFDGFHGHYGLVIVTLLVTIASGAWECDWQRIPPATMIFKLSNTHCHCVIIQGRKKRLPYILPLSLRVCLKPPKVFFCSRTRMVFIKAARNLRRFETDPRTELSRWSWNYPTWLWLLHSHGIDGPQK